MPAIIEGKKYNISGLEIRDYEETGITFERNQYPKSNYPRKNTPVRMIVLHWTGGENQDPRTVKRTLVKKGAGYHFFITLEGVIYQYIDTANACIHSEYSRDTIGVSLQNPGFPGGGRRASSQRDLYTADILGRRRNLYTFTDAQIRAAKKLTRFLCDKYNVPYRVPVNKSDNTLITEVLPQQQQRNYRGVVGHFHVSKTGKVDPGLDLLNSIIEEAEPPSDSEFVGKASPETIEQNSRRRPIEKKSDPIIEKYEAMTQNRTGPPTDFILPYSVLEGGGEFDPNAGQEISPDSPVIADPSNRFIEQLAALKKVSNLQLAQAVPILQIFVYDENGEYVNLNEKIFSKSSFHNMFDSVDVDLLNNERPIASLVSFEENIDEPGAGGAYGISKAKLMLKFHNLSAITVDHPTGKYLSYMLDVGLPLRIRFGVEHPDPSLNVAFQWVEKDFIISHHNVTINDDLTADATFHMTIATQKLMNRFHVGQSIIIAGVSENDINLATDNLQIQKDLKETFELANTKEKGVGMGVVLNESGSLQTTLKGAISNLQSIFERDDIGATRIENTVNALQTIQSTLLTKKYDSILSVFSYGYENNDTKYPAVNIGTLVEKMVKPELETVIKYITTKDVNIGQRYSTESTPAGSTDVHLIFGNFNQDAGSQWAGKPISSFPINIESLFSYLRENREVGKFNGTINGFMNKLARWVSDSANFKVSKDKDRSNVAETPQLKYDWYKSSDPSNPAWIFYIFDVKDKVVKIKNLLKDVRKTNKEEIKSLLEQRNAPFLEPGSDSSLIRGLSAQTLDGDRIGTQALLRANSDNYNSRQIDGASQRTLPSGISSEFFSGIQIDPNQVVRRDELVIPLQMTIDHYIMVTTEMFGMLYVFNPLLRYAKLYQIMQVQHTITNGKPSTNISLLVQL